MNIATVQKRRFLNNIYKLFYSSGVQPDERQVRAAFNEYFSINTPGFPVKVDYDLLRSKAKTDVDLLNQIMANTLFNVDVLYDAILDNNEELFSAVTSLNKKLESLKNKRLELESKIDDLLFVNNNSDGYFYSITENFASAKNLDLNLSDSVFFDPNYKNVTISKLRSEQFTPLTLDNLRTINPEFSVSINGQTLSQSVDSTNFNNLFDGLNDTYWDYAIALAKPESVAVSITIPVSVFSLISKIDGVVYTSSPLNISMVARYSDSTKPNEIRSQNSRGDYGTFSFAIPSDIYGSIQLTLYKNEPDYIQEDSSSPYVYRFGLRDLVIGSKYYARSGFLVSAPLRLPLRQNSNLVIDAVSVDVKEQIVPGTSLNYYVAPDNPLAESISDFSWTPISPTGSEDSGYASVVYLDGSLRRNIYIKNNPDVNDIKYIPIVSSTNNFNELNPNNKIYTDKNIFRIAALSSDLSFINPILLANVDCFKHSYIIIPGENSNNSKYKDLEFWNSTIRDRPVDLLSSTLKEQLGSINPGINTYSSGYIQTNIMRTAPVSLVHTVTKSSSNFNLAIYLNGILIADLPKGVTSKAIQWDFSSGMNNIVITYDKNYIGQMNFSLIEGLNISRYGSIFADFFNYLDPLEFQNKVTEDNYYFTIDTVFGRKEILASKSISGDSNFIFTSKNSSAVEAVRFRVDFTRYDNPYITPILESIRVKFKHTDS
jgi:hypothetical protein